MSINLIAKDNLTNIINFTPPNKQETTNYCLVSKLWNDVASSDPVWRLIAEGEGVKISGKNDRSIKELFCLFHSRKITSNDEIIIRFQQFLDRCSIDKNCRFKCILGLGSGHGHLTVEIGDPERQAQNHPTHYMNFINPHEIDIREDYFCVNGLGDSDLIQFLPPNASSIQEIRRCRGSFSADCIFSEPNYSNQAQPRETLYSQITHIWDRAITISVPTRYAPDAGDTPLLRQMESMATSKLGKFPISRKQVCLRIITGLVFFTSIGMAAGLLTEQLLNVYSANK